MAENTPRTFHFTVTGDLNAVPLDLLVAGHELGTKWATPGHEKEELDEEDVHTQMRWAFRSSSTPEAALDALLREALTLGLNALVPTARLEAVQAALRDTANDAGGEDPQDRP
jgi:hypothetical protein